MTLGLPTPRLRTLVIALATLGGAIYLSASQSTDPENSAERPPKRVVTGTVDTAADHRELRFSGVTRAADRARVAFSLGGRVLDRPVDVGDRVRAGDVLARLDSLEARNAVAGAEGQLAELAARRAQAERDVARAQALLDSKAATAEEVEKTRAGLDAVEAAEASAEARLREARRLLGETVLEAPFAGTVTEVHFEPGEYAVPGRPVVTLAGDGAVEVEVEVPESVVSRIAVGDTVAAHLPTFGLDTLEATIESVGRAAAGPGRLFPVIARLPESSGGSTSPVVGATAELVLSLTRDAALTVPVEAVIDPGGRRPAVYAVGEDGRVAKVRVDVGTLLGDRVVVTLAEGFEDALVPGDRVVVGGQRGLLDGERVEAVAR